jgi:hypothetical protein
MEREAISKLKICCVLDPTRAAKARKDVMGNTCWCDVELQGGVEEVQELLSSPGLQGYVFKAPGQGHEVTIYDWVSGATDQSLFYLTKTQAYVAYSCFRGAGYGVVFKIWSEFSTMITGRSADSAADSLRSDGFDCVFGGIDLSIRCV